MKNIQKIAFLAFALFFAFSVSTFAQGRGGKHHNQEQKLEKMKTELGLSDSQVEQIKTIYTSNKEQNKGLRQEAKNGNEESKAKLKANRTAMKAEVNKILTPEQLKKAEALKAERKNPANRAEKHVQKMKTELSLSDTQTPKVKAALVTKMTKMQALKEKAGDAKVDKTERKAVKTAFETELKSILSSEQFTKYEQIKADKKAKHGKHGKGKKGQHKREKEIEQNNTPVER